MTTELLQAQPQLPIRPRRRLQLANTGEKLVTPHLRIRHPCVSLNHRCSNSGNSYSKPN